MAPLSLRSLLLAAVVISDCITWTASRHHYTHNVSGHRSRHRRQGAGLYLSASYVIPGGEGSGAWGEWSKDISPCSRTCGGGVASQKRICIEFDVDGRPLCSGGDTRYFSCQTQDCPEGSTDFRTEQCAEYDRDYFRGARYNWVPYTKAPNPCELNCMPRGERFYYRHKSKVTDGTRCNDESFDVCVDGTCQPVGCDMMLGSNAREDRCRECRGNNTNCHTVTGEIPPEQELRQGYNDVLLIPEGATTIVISEVRDSNNYLALRSKKTGKYYLNGDYHIDFPRTLLIAGALWHYERSQQGFAAPDKLRCQGPTNETLYLSLLLQDVNVGIEYEYSIPSALAPPPNQQYNWVHGEFTPCSATCGGGFQTRTVSCRSREELEIVEDSLCDDGLKPPANQSCSTQPCAARWVEGPWGPCSEPCGKGGTRSRQVHCEKIIANGLPSIVSDQECLELLGKHPALHEECNKDAACPVWYTGPWKPCDKLCGEGKQTRQVVCYQKDEKGRIEALPDGDCADEKPPTEQGCMLHPCEGVDYVLSEWSGCDSCLSTVRSRTAKCVTKEDQKVLNDSFCSYHPKPVLEEPCDRTKLPPCQVQWYATQWSNCSVQCGKGVQTRRVFCGLFDGSSVLKVDDERCNKDERYNESKPCEIPPEKCPAKWYAGPWGVCTKECGGGEQYREAMCLLGNEPSGSCDEEAFPSTTQSCNKGPCDKDEMLPVDASATPVMDDDYDEDCEEEEDYPEMGLEEDDVLGEAGGKELGLIDEGMLSDSPYTEGSGFTELESTFTTIEGSGSEPTGLTTEESSGSEPTDETLSTSESEGTSESESTSESSATSESATTESSATETTESDATSSSTESSATSESSPTDETETSASSESSATSESDGTTESSETTESASTDTTGSSESSDTTESLSTDMTEISTTESSTTESSDTSETSSETSSTSESSTGSETDGSTTESGTTESGTTESISTDSSTASGTAESDSTSESSGSTDMDSTGSSETTESGPTTESGATSETESEVTTESGATSETESEVTTESGATSESESTGTSESGATSESESTATSESGATSETESTGSSESESTSETESEGTTESGATSESESTESESTSESSATTETESVGTTESGATSETETEGTTESGATSESTSEMSTEYTDTTEWTWASTIESTTKKAQCKRRKSKCHKSKFGCCPDKRTPAAGPFDAGCPTPETCKESKYGCCPDGVSPAGGPKNQDCPTVACKETLFGCCKSDNKTPAEGNDQEGCPPPPPACKSSKFGCCKDGKTGAKGPNKKGCPEKEPKKNCKDYKFGCCYDNKTEATGPNEEGCPCNVTEFGCCPDGVSTARGAQMEGCVMSCNTSAYGCCPDNETPAHGPDFEGCCLQTAYGCCPDNYKAAGGPHLEDCGCQYAHYGCCPDNVTVARGPNNEGCGCEYSEFGCCPDRHTDATGPEFEGCGCHTYQFGCCPDGVTIAKGPNLQGCHCQQSQFGCCGDGQTAAAGPDQAGCDCSSSKYGCCPDGITEAKGEKFLNCTDVPENRQAACSLSTDRGPCRNYSVYWYYDMEYGGCSRFWYGGCDGNGNRFSSKEECEDVCVHPSPKDACKLPKVKGACQGYHLRWYYDPDREQCGQFAFGGCLGNANNFDSRELCQEKCEPAKSDDQCQLPIERGSCAGNFGRWGFNSETRKCEQFIWGGCEGNANRFGSEAACVMRCDPPGALQPECSEPQEVGNCTEKQAVWSFSQTENRCVPFYYTGCNGNDNRFDSEQGCAEACPSAYVQDLCTLPAVTGECADYRERWYFDTAQKRCRQFYYGGCGENGNNFGTEQECENRCKAGEMVTATVATPQTPEPFRTEFCFLEKDPGPCSQSEPRWAYDSSLGQCTTFQYGGCGGNRNNFPSQEYCAYYCMQTQDICQLPMRAGPCYASVMRYFYDPTTDSCSQFTYGGCDGNGNNFETLEQCERRCRSTQPPTTTTTVAPATQPPPSLPRECYTSSELEECSSPGEVWYYHPYQQECLLHQNLDGGRQCRYTGTFPSEEACQRSCGAFRDLEVCRYPVDPGPCRAAIGKFFFDQSTGRCEQFAYGGCHGGPNRFSTQQECEQVCNVVTDPCKQLLATGNCLENEEKWYYEESSDSCNTFLYSGCDGNENRFDSQGDCEAQCRRRPPPITTTTTQSAPVEPVEEQCRTPDSLQPCLPNITVFYWDESSSSCRSADIGGCRYVNSYRSEEECERQCGAFRDLPDICNSPLDPGPCRAAIPKVYFDLTTGRCTPFAYGGCHGGPNRFSTIDECEEYCGPPPEAVCQLPVDTGAACGGGGASQLRWYYDQGRTECVRFGYSGCGGNENNFLSINECVAVCNYRDMSNEVLPPDCSAFIEECERIQCPYSVQRTRTPDGCERCGCVPVEIDCEPLRLECERLKCTYGMDRETGEDGCERCRCIEHPCAGKECPAGERCVANAYRDPVTQEPRYSADCRTMSKAGVCPAEEGEAAGEGPASCRRECNDDADCERDIKCCARGCSQLCLAPAAPTAPTSPRPAPTQQPELPQAPQASVETEPEVTAREGGRATLRCLFHGNPPPKITWRRGEITIDGTVGRYRVLSNGALEIVSLYRNDSGVYICIADNGLGTARQEIHLQVNDPVESPAGISGEPDAIVVGELGQSLRLRCLAFGYPEPVIYWYRGHSGPMVPFTSSLYEARGTDLLIRVLNEETLGEYECHAYNGKGKPAQWPVAVQARRPEGAPPGPWLVEQQAVVVTPRPQYTEPAPEPSPQPDIEVPVYTAPVSTQIQLDSSVVQSGAELSVRCEVDGYPTPDVAWTKDGARLAPSDRIEITEARLTIRGVSPADSGEYGCHAHNAFSEHHSTAHITVQGVEIPARCTDNPFFANCELIVRSKFCLHKYYSKFCCKSCVESGQMKPEDLQGMQADEAWKRKK